MTGGGSFQPPRPQGHAHDVVHLDSMAVTGSLTSTVCGSHRCLNIAMMLIGNSAANNLSTRASILINDMHYILVEFGSI